MEKINITVDFLEEDDKNKLLLLNYVNLKCNKINTFEELSIGTGYSNFILNKYIQEICSDLNDIEYSIGNKKKIEYLIIDQIIFSKLKLKYVNRAVLFKLFYEYFQGRVSLLKFAKKNYLSRSKVYEVKNELKKILQSHSINIKDGFLIGKEIDIRKIAFKLFFYFFNGSPTDIDKDIQLDKDMIISGVIKHFNLDLEYTKNVKLNVYVYIICVRIKAQKYLGNELPLILNKNIFKKKEWNKF